MMKRQFLRVKQIADQTFQRAEKSELLTEELNAAEKRVDLIKDSCSANGKKLAACTQRLAQDTVDRKTIKKIPEAALAQCMEESGLHLGESSILGMTLIDCARMQEVLASDLYLYKTLVEETVVEPLQNILKTDVSNILKYRKQLAKLTSEMDSSRMRYQNSLKNCQQTTGNGSAAAAAKTQLLKEESEDSSSRADQCRDALAAEMFNLISKEPELSQLYVRLCQLELEYHRKALSVLESCVPDLEAQIKSWPYQPVFGFPLEEHLKVTQREIAVVVESCVCWLLESAMDEEGLFRIGGSLTKIKKMKSAFDAGLYHLVEDDRDPHNVAGVLKLYLRSLPEPLLTYSLYEDFMEAAMEQDHDTRLRYLWGVVNSLPEANLKNLRYLVKFFAKLCENSSVNKMSIHNIAIVIGPNLIWPQVDEQALGMNMAATNFHSSIVDTLITYSDWFFPGECEFSVSTPTSPRHIQGFPPPSLSSSQLSLSTAKLSNGDSAVESLSSSPTNSSPKSPSPRVVVRPRKKAAPRAPDSQSAKNQITRSLSCGGFKTGLITRTISSSRLSQYSISHEDLLNAAYKDSIYKDANKDLKEVNTQIVNGRPRTKPPRQPRNGLPPLVERSSRSIERPTVPPPERPDSFSSSLSGGSISSPTSSSYGKEKIIDLDDISISVESSGSETYNECQMSFMDDSENEDESKFKMTQTTTNEDSSFKSQKEEVAEFGVQSILDQSDTSNAVNDTKFPFHALQDKNHERNFIEEVEDVNFQPSLMDHYYGDVKLKRIPDNQTPVINEEIETDNNLEIDFNSQQLTLDSQINGHCSSSDVRHSSDVRSNGLETSEINHYNGSDTEFFGGTPTWFEHYGDDKRQSNTVWFRHDEIPVFEDTQDSSPSDDFRTIIEVGNTNFMSSNCSPKQTVSGTAIKLRVNSESQNTRL